MRTIGYALQEFEEKLTVDDLSLYAILGQWSCDFENTIRRALRILAAIEEGKAKLVPVEPSWEMEHASMIKASDDIYNDAETEEFAPDTTECGMIYKAAIAAAPSIDEIIGE